MVLWPGHYGMCVFKSFCALLIVFVRSSLYPVNINTLRLYDYNHLRALWTVATWECWRRASRLTLSCSCCCCWAWARWAESESTWTNSSWTRARRQLQLLRPLMWQPSFSLVLRQKTTINHNYMRSQVNRWAEELRWMIKYHFWHRRNWASWGRAAAPRWVCCLCSDTDRPTVWSHSARLAWSRCVALSRSDSLSRRWATWALGPLLHTLRREISKQQPQN